ncbi:MAG: 3-methyl-2-oxobutanoate hydroxymethyltransferase [Verrucomicrobiales bacterium]|nr:3-methyl-2-oxobutanoate hydroxymethyltransferase [Verrucomicrobiales bacterium]
MRAVRESGRRICALTAYDFPTAKFCDESGVDFILVGDSLGMVVAGNPDTTSVTLDHMIYHTEMVARAVESAVLVGDLPYKTYETPETAVENGKRLIDAGAHAAKLEGGIRQAHKVEAMTSAGIPVCAHIGMLPQRVVEEGGYKKKGKSDAEVEYLIQSARDLESAGAGAIVLESIVPSVARKICEAVEIPTIGIGAGSACDGEIRVIHDIVGGYPWFVPPFAKPHADIAAEYRRAIEAYREEIQPSD